MKIGLLFARLLCRKLKYRLEGNPENEQEYSIMNSLSFLYMLKAKVERFLGNTFLYYHTLCQIYRKSSISPPSLALFNKPPISNSNSK